LSEFPTFKFGVWSFCKVMGVQRKGGVYDP
jgi:hypothetical protein